MAPSSASWPSVAETVDWLISASSTGSAPIRRNSARSWASVIVKLPEICAPLSPEIPVGFSLKLMIGRETTSPSRTTANESEKLAACSGVIVGPWTPALLEASLGNPLGHVRERLLALVREVEGDVRDVRDGVEVLLRVADVVTRQLGAVL